MTIGRVLAGIRDTMRLLSPTVRAERAYTLDRERIIRESSMLALEGAAWLSRRHGAGFDERVVEYPWMFDRIGRGRTLLDVGSTLNNDAIHELVMGRYPRVIHLNPYRDDATRSSSAAVRYVRADVRSPSLRGGFTLITCLSTLEHVGRDNSRYGGASGTPGSGQARAAAMRAMRSLLPAGGRLLLTVPYGRSEDHGWFEQLDARALDDAVAAFNPAARSDSYFLHADGWSNASATQCAAASYGAGSRGATAVACLELTA